MKTTNNFTRYFLRVLSLLTLSLTLLHFASCTKPDIRVHQETLQTEIDVIGRCKILIDVIDPDFTLNQLTEYDVIAVTFSGPDHYSPALVDEFKGVKLLYSSGRFEKNGVTVEMIPSARNEGDIFNNDEATNYMVMITVDSNKILYCGDIGQEHFTTEQLEKIGTVDLCFSPLESNLINMNLNNKKGFTLLDELKPKLVLPLRYKDLSLEYALSLAPLFTGQDGYNAVSFKNLPEERSFLILGAMAPVYQNLYGLKDWK